MRVHPVLVAGAGPAGLTAALELARVGVPVAVHEAEHAGRRHRAHRDLSRLSLRHRRPPLLHEGRRGRAPLARVARPRADPRAAPLAHLLRGRFYAYPLQLPNVVRNLGLVESARMTSSYLRAQLQPADPEETLEEWVVNRFGERLYRTFFKTYTEKVWGIPCNEIRADWAAQRIRGLSFTRAVSHAIFAQRADDVAGRRVPVPAPGAGPDVGARRRGHHGRRRHREAAQPRRRAPPRTAAASRSATLECGGRARDHRGVRRHQQHAAAGPGPDAGPGRRRRRRSRRPRACASATS